ncbi:MAG: nuclear transport factor 2 family protein [Fimbriimonadaceae bacterium]|nr:nuclear transport factor 2 family protein [Fimbriimonadaceae bacterium]
MDSAQPLAVRLISAYVAAFNRDDVEGQLAVLAPDVVHDINEGGTEIGIEAYRAFKAHMDAHYAERLEEVRVYGDDTGGACEFIVRGRYLRTDGSLPPATGQAYAVRSGFFVDVSDGKISRITSYYNLRKWCEAVVGDC